MNTNGIFSLQEKFFLLISGEYISMKKKISDVDKKYQRIMDNLETIKNDNKKKDSIA